MEGGKSQFLQGGDLREPVTPVPVCVQSLRPRRVYGVAPVKAASQTREERVFPRQPKPGRQPMSPCEGVRREGLSLTPGRVSLLAPVRALKANGAGPANLLC